MLVEQIKLYFGPGFENPESRISISNGTAPAPKGYREGGRLPKEPWIKPTAEDLAILIETDYSKLSLDYSETVGLVKLPEELINIFETLGLRRAKTNQELGEIILSHKENMVEFDHVLNEFLSEFYTEKQRRRFLGAFALPPNLLSIATDKNTGAPLGLHFDNSIGFPVEQFEGKPGRISMNVGEQRRYLYYVNRSLEEVFHEMVNKGCQFEDEVELANLFLKEYPEYPIVRVAVEPYEAYIAPTDHVIHDGCTIGTSKTDITLVIMGYFGPHKSILNLEKSNELH